MIAVVQRVQRAEVRVAGAPCGCIGGGLLILLGVARGDTARDAQWLAQKCLSLRVFQDAAGKMNLALSDVSGEILVVSQFTLLGDCVKGRRPSWSEAADPDQAEALYTSFVDELRRGPQRVATGVFQAHMEVESVNDGPVTLILDSRQWKGRPSESPASAAGRAQTLSPPDDAATAGDGITGGERLLRGRAGPLILASRSPRRAQLLQMLGVRFTTMDPEEDGGGPREGEDPARYAVRQAEAKALSVAHRVRDGVVLAADTVVYLDGEVLEKPGNPEEAVASLRRLAGREHDVFTGLCLVRAGIGARVTGVERSRVRMSALDERTIREYVGTGEPLDKAGAYGIQGVGGMLVASIEGCYFNVMGLPLARLRALFRELAEATGDPDH